MLLERISDERGEYLIYDGGSGQSFSVDASDQSAVEAHSWRVVFFKPNHWYVVRNNGAGLTLLHRVLMDAPTDKNVDHRDSDGTNNRRHNMRLSTWVQNLYNRRQSKPSASGYRGVYPTDSGRYTVIISIGNIKRGLGTYDDPTEAARVWDSEAFKHRGEFAVLNFPLETAT